MLPHHKTRNTRVGRYSEPGRIYLLTSVTKDRQTFFADWRLGALVARELDRAGRGGVIDTLAWVVMPDHFHWLVQLKDRPLSEVIALTKSKGNHLVNKTLSRSGSI